MTAEIIVEVVVATAERQELVSLSLPAGTTVDEAIESSGILASFPQLHRQSLVPGIWGRPVAPDRVLQTGDRVELYRPLETDPREARRLRATKAAKGPG